MMDGSLLIVGKTLSSCDYNIEVTRCVSDIATALAIGIRHSAYKFSCKPTGYILAMEDISAIHAQIPDMHLVMHIPSSMPQKWLEIIRLFSGNFKETYGLSVEKIQYGIQSAVRKINIDTDIRPARDF